MKPAIYLTDPKEMRRVRLNQPPLTSEQFRAQLEAMRRATAKFSAVARPGTSSRGRAKSAA